MSDLVEKLWQNRDLSDKELKKLIETSEYDTELFARADEVRRQIYGEDVFIRGLIEISNYCKNDCLYCGIRRSNKKAIRYRLEKEEILACCDRGYELGFRTFVLQGGEDEYYTDERLCEIVRAIRRKYPDCAITLSMGERSKESYEKLIEAGAERYLLRHETADEAHYQKLHPQELSLENRKQCLWELKELGYQAGAGFMVGSPYQKTEYLISDLRFLQDLRPAMIGIGPFVPHKDTPFAQEKGGTLELTLRMIAILRLMFPYVLLPATTALGTIHPQGRELGLKAGANVVMPNLSPRKTRGWYELYDNKISEGAESAQGLSELKMRVEALGYQIVTDRGDVCMDIPW